MSAPIVQRMIRRFRGKDGKRAKLTHPVSYRCHPSGGGDRYRDGRRRLLPRLSPLLGGADERASV